MKFKFAVSMALATAFLSLANSSRAVVYTETTDAGDLPSTATVISGPASTSLTGIVGSLSLANGVSDSDMFEIYINSPSTFSASLTGFVIGSNNFDSQISIFNSAGVGVAANDDDPVTGAPQSNLPAGSSLLSAQTAGVYYLLVSGSGRYATDASGNLIFPNFNDNVTDPSTVVGKSSGSAVAGYSGNSNEGGSYSIALTGAQFVVSAIPEPSTLAFVLGGAVGVGVIGRLRRRA